MIARAWRKGEMGVIKAYFRSDKNGIYFWSDNNVLELNSGHGCHSSTLAWKIQWTEEPGGLQSIGWLRVGHD